MRRKISATTQSARASIRCRQRSRHRQQREHRSYDVRAMTIEAINPATGERIAKHDEMPGTIVSGIIDGVHATFLDWRHTSFEERAAPMRKAAEILRAEAGDYARLMAREMGKP